MNRLVAGIKYMLIGLLFVLICLSSDAQSEYKGFNETYYKNDPARDTVDFQSKKQIHKQFIQKSLHSGDRFKAVLGNLYLSNDHFVLSEYDSALIDIQKAYVLAEKLNDTLLMGRALHKKGGVLSVIDRHQSALETFEQALRFNEIAGDSQYLAITLEQLATNNSNLKNYDESNAYFSRAIPLVKKYGRPASLSTSYINYGNSLSYQGHLDSAIQQYQYAIEIGQEIKDDYEVIPAKQNLALVYYKMDSLAKALSLYQECKELNEANRWLDYLIYSYDGLSITYEGMGQLDSAIYYNRKYYELKDSIIGVDMNSKIDALENSLKLKEKNIEVLTEKQNLIDYKKKMFFIGLVLFLLIGLAALYVFHKFQIASKLRAENQANLIGITKLLENKNQELKSLRSQLNHETDHALQEINLYDLNILTDEDWQTFKTTFEKSYPNYITKIRQHYPSISEAEERLFLFIKLNLTTKEAAGILGVQVDTIKKGRTRLRKRLELMQNQKLDEFIMSF